MNPSVRSTSDRSAPSSHVGGGAQVIVWAVGCWPLLPRSGGRNDRAALAGRKWAQVP
ncbi:hypothetical protein BS78_01G343000 [Paspalum vaginatum]|nr:hypothetical protein BS78_01G343000 [Paspalum vaginatum]